MASAGEFTGQTGHPGDAAVRILQSPEAIQTHKERARKPLQSVLDALADAETLRRFLRTRMSAHEWRFRSGLCYRWPAKGTWPDPISAIHKARAAFRAIPGLRG